MAIIDLGGRFQKAFGFVPEQKGGDIPSVFDRVLQGADVSVADSRATFENFKLKFNDNEFEFKFTGLWKMDNSVFAPPAIVSFVHSKTLGESAVSDNDENGQQIRFGQVVEKYNTKPIEFTIKGLLIDSVKRQYPSRKVRELMKLFYYDGIVDVEGQLFRDRKINSIYFTGLDESPVAGYMDTWSFELGCKSIKPVEYFLTNNNNG